MGESPSTMARRSSSSSGRVSFVHRGAASKIQAGFRGKAGGIDFAKFLRSFTHTQNPL